MDSKLTRLFSHVTDRYEAAWLVAQAKEDVANVCGGNFDRYVSEIYDTGKYGWKHPMFDAIAKRLKNYDEYILKPYEVEEGVLTCRKCKSKRVYSSVVQTRAADEPMTTLAKCAQCNYKWSQNG